jgi:hypothetical protein
MAEGLSVGWGERKEVRRIWEKRVYASQNSNYNCTGTCTSYLFDSTLWGAQIWFSEWRQ